LQLHITKIAAGSFRESDQLPKMTIILIEKRSRLRIRFIVGSSYHDTNGHQAGKVRAELMDSETFSGIVWGTVLFGFLVSFYVAHYRRRRRTERMLIMELLKRYFEGAVSADQLGQRAREIADRHFIQSAEFYALAIAGFQRAVDARFGNEKHSKEDESKLLSLLATLKSEFGLTDRYQVEAWRPGRE
jgi:hypothetical protein